METLIALFGVAALVIAAVFYGAFSWGLVTYKVWIWYLLPVFPNLPHITYLQAVGFSLVIELFRDHSNNSNIKSEFKDGQSGLWNSLLAPWVVLFSAWFIHLFI